MITKISTVEELKGIYIEMFLNNTDKVTKVSPLSVNNGIAYGVAKIGQKILKDVAVLESHLFPEDAYGENLDVIAQRYGISNRFGSSQSSTYVRVVGDINTSYIAGFHTFKSLDGTVFDVEQTLNIGASGFGYVKVRSQSLGEKTNSAPLSITSVNPVPVGHKYCINEYNATGGRDSENDDDFRNRIMNGCNFIATGTIGLLEQSLIKVNPNVLKVIHNGIASDGQVLLSVVSQNGIDFTDNEFNQMMVGLEKHISLVDYKPNGSSKFGVKLQNPVWYPIDVSYRCILESGFDATNIRKETQLRMNKFIDYRYFKGNLIEWEDLLIIVKGVPGVRRILDNTFSPKIDIKIPSNQIPRIRGFIMLNPDGTVMSEVSGTLNPYYYPSVADFSLQQTLL
jgi:hypothetical protein